MDKLDAKYLNAVSLIEAWLVLIFIVLIIICKKTSFLLFPLFLCLSSTVLFATIIVCAITIIIFTPNGYKCAILLPLVRLGLNINCPISVTNFPKTVDNTIFLCNYPANFVEYLLVPSLLQQFALPFSIVTSSKSGFWAKFFMDSETIISLDNVDNNFDSMNNKITLACKSGRLPIIYPERNFWKRQTIDSIQEFRTGIFEIAKKNKFKICLVTVDHIQHSFGVVQNKQIRIQFQETIGYNSVEAREKMITLLKNEDYQTDNSIDETISL